MSLPQFFGYGVLTFVIWKLVRRLALKRSNALNVAGPEKGKLESIFIDSFERSLSLAAHYGGAFKLSALSGEQWLYVSDPRALHHILVKEQHIFEENDSFLLCNQLIFGEGLISTLGEQHRKQRKMLNPVFSTANMRNILPIIQTISHQLKSILVEKASAHASVEFDVLPWLTRSALDCVCEGVLGYHSNTLCTGNENENEYTEALRMLSPLITNTMLYRYFVPPIMRNVSLYWRQKMVDWLTISLLPTQTMKNFRQLRHAVNVMDSASRAIFQEKKDALDLISSSSRQSNDMPGETKGKDVMSIMLKSNASSSEADRLSDSELFGQMNVMIFAGLETTTAAVARALEMLAKHPHVQAQLRAEICDAMTAYQASHDDSGQIKGESGSVRLSYDVLMGLPLLDAVVRETLRLYPSLPLLTRKTTEATSVPLQFPVQSTSGEEINVIPVAKNQRFVVSIIAANHNKAVWGEDASEWKPERWLNSSDGIIPGVKDGVRYPGIYSSMMTFLAGGRSCIGFKFAEMEIKDLLATILPEIEFALASEPDEDGNVKEIYWKMGAFHIPVVKPPAGDGKTPQLPLVMRLVG